MSSLIFQAFLRKLNLLGIEKVRIQELKFTKIETFSDEKLLEEKKL
jgi:hypothetical protein